MFRYLLTSFALAAQLIAAGPVLAEGSMPDPSPAASDARPQPSVSPPGSSQIPAPVQIIVVVAGEGWG
jgi:hypothetical protein